MSIYLAWVVIFKCHSVSLYTLYSFLNLRLTEYPFQSWKVILYHQTSFISELPNLTGIFIRVLQHFKITWYISGHNSDRYANLSKRVKPSDHPQIEKLACLGYVVNDLGIITLRILKACNPSIYLYSNVCNTWNQSWYESCDSFGRLTTSTYISTYSHSFVI